MSIKTNNANPQFYADFASLQKLKSSAHNDESKVLKQVAQQFEQMFMSELMKSMRKANEAFGKDSVFNSSETQFYQGMLDSQVALEMSQNRGFGLADVLVKQLSRQLDVKLGDKDDEKDQPRLSEAEQLINRAFDQGATSAVTQALDQVNSLNETPPSVTPLSETIDNLVNQIAARQKETQLSAEQSSAVKPPFVLTNPEWANIPEQFSSPEHFVEALLPIAKEVATELGVDPKVLLAQAALETGWGKHVIRNGDSSSFNLFNIKADGRWDGDKSQVSTVEYRNGIAQREQALFRSYGSYEESFRDYVSFLKDSPRYQRALEMAADPKQYLQQLQKAGYATDPAYADKITDIFEQRILAMGLNRSKEG